ncbi:MAG: 2OG-Fe(II) oxygenase [Rhizomicrobium sp.]
MKDQDWKKVAACLDAQGWALLPGLLDASICKSLRGSYDTSRFRKQVVMARHGFGSGEYKYFAYPLPGRIARLRETLYRHLVPVANLWADESGAPLSFPPQHGAYLERCHRAGQVRPTPLMLKYGPSDYNCLHQDLYGEHVFPLQVVILLSEPGKDFEGGEFVITEQRPRAQSRASVVPLSLGCAVAFAVHHRPVKGKRGFYKVNHRHGVSALTSGERYTLGIIFHDAA